jgi:hypothetical protein
VKKVTAPDCVKGGEKVGHEAAALMLRRPE